MENNNKTVDFITWKNTLNNTKEGFEEYLYFKTDSDCFAFKIKDMGGLECNITQLNTEDDKQPAIEKFNKMNFSNIKVNEGYLMVGVVENAFSMDYHLNNIEPSELTIDAGNRFYISKKDDYLHYAHLILPQWNRYNNFYNKEIKTNTSYMINSTPRMIFETININLVSPDGHIILSKYRMPQEVSVVDDCIANIRVDKNVLLSIKSPSEFSFYALDGEKINEIEIDNNRPVNCIYNNGKIEISSFVGKDGQEHKLLNNQKQEEEFLNNNKQVAYKTIETIIKNIFTIQNNEINSIFLPHHKKINEIVKNIKDLKKLLQINNTLYDIEIQTKDNNQKNNIEKYKEKLNTLYKLCNINQEYTTKTTQNNKTNNNTEYTKWFNKHSQTANQQLEEEIEKEDEEQFKRIDIPYDKWFNNHNEKNENNTEDNQPEVKEANQPEDNQPEQTDEEYCKNIIDTFVKNGTELIEFDVARFRRYNEGNHLLQHKSACFWFNVEERRNNALLDFINNDADKSLDTLNNRLRNIIGGKCSWCCGDW